MIDGSKATERQIVGPVEATEIVWVFHTLWPIFFSFQIVGDFSTLFLVLLARFILLLHQSLVQNVHFLGLLDIFGLHLLDKTAQLLSATLVFLWEVVISGLHLSSRIGLVDLLRVNGLLVSDEMRSWH